MRAIGVFRYQSATMESGCRTNSVGHCRGGSHHDGPTHAVSGGPHFLIGIDLRLFMAGWTHLVHTVIDNARGPLRGFQVYDASGQAIHKVYASKDTDLQAWDDLVAELTDDAPAPLALVAPEPAKADPPDADVDVDGFREGWEALKDTHDFHPLLRKHALGRLQAMRLAGEARARPVPTSVVGELLDKVAADGTPIMCFVGNPGCIQIHSGPVKTIAWRGDWLNVLDPAFNLHLDTSGLAHAFVVRKPTKDGDVNSLELFSEDGTLVAQFFGARKPGIPEIPEWTETVKALG